jgi:hypothetical protein
MKFWKNQRKTPENKLKEPNFKMGRNFQMKN